MGSSGRRFDAVMNYPLAQAILGFTAQGHLDEDVVRRHHEYGRTVVRRDAAAFGAELERLMALYDPAVTQVQLNLLDSHDTERLLWTLTPGAETTAGKELDAANVAAGKARVRLASLIQSIIL